MEEEQFFAHVRERADLESEAAAREATDATLQVFGSRLTEPEAEAEDLAAQLPEPLSADLTSESRSEPESFDVESFVERVRDHEAGGNLDETAAETHAQAVISTIDDAVTGGELEDVRAQLPEEYDRLFDSTHPEA